MARRYSYYSDYGYFRQPTSYEIEQSALESIAKAKKKGIIYHPVKAESNKIANTWWGRSWCDNLERYADYANRLPRGKKYVKASAVLDLNIDKCLVEAIVQGSSLYKVRVSFDPLAPQKEKELANLCSRQIQNVEQLISGEFPESLKNLFYEKGGLFPSPKEIHMRCSCPDSAGMCKHLAAAMYGVGVRLDSDPLLFFKLRGIDVEPFVTHVIEDKVNSMLDNAGKKSKRIIPEDEISGLFGVL